MAGIFIGYAKAAGATACAGVGAAMTGGAVVYGGVTGDNRARDGLANATRQYGCWAGEGLAEAGRGIVDTSRAGLAVVDSVNPMGNYCPLFPQPNLNQFAYACAKVSSLVYDAYSSRPSNFRDREGDTWTEVRPDDCPRTYDTTYLTVYQCGQDIIIGCRGTCAEVGDALSDASIVLTSIPPFRNQEADDFAMAMRRIRRYRTIYLAGHSLGGTIAMGVGLRQDFPVHCFNPGAAPHDSIASSIIHGAAVLTGATSKIRVHRIHTDLISACVTSSSRVEVQSYRKSQDGLAHSLHQFL